MSIPAVILGDDPFNGLGVARNLGRKGVLVYRAGAVREPVLRSRYIRRHWVVPDLEQCSDDTFVRHLVDLARQLGSRAVLFPISDLYVLKVARLREELEPHFRIVTCNPAAAETLINKHRFSLFLEEHGIPHPRTRSIRNADEFAAAGEFLYPVFVKPEISPLFAQAFGCKGFVSHDRKQLRTHLQTAWDAGLEVLAQEIIPGPAANMRGCAGLWADGRALSVCYQRVREFPLGFGCGTLLQTIPSFFADTRLSECFERLDYAGIFDAEFKLDARDQSLKLIEINARSWWQNSLPAAAGCDVVHAAYAHAADLAPEVPTDPEPYREGVTWACLALDLRSALAGGTSLASWLRSLLGTRTFAVLASDDIVPFLHRLGRVIAGRFGA